MKEKKPEVLKEELSPAGSLSEILKNDPALKEDQEKRILYTSYASLFDSDLIENLHFTSIELNDKYNTSNPSSWREFLRHPIVKRYIDGFLNERTEKTADVSLGAVGFKPKDALKIKETMSAKNKGEDNSNILVVFLPQKDFTL
jgi:hypothetical protein